MASTSASRAAGGDAGRLKNAAFTLHSDNQTLIAEIRKAVTLMKEVAVDLERDGQSQMVKELEDATAELLGTSEDYAHFLAAIQSVGNEYQPGPEFTDFKKLFADEVAKAKADSSFAPQTQRLLHQFREAVWNVHHAGEAMPGDEQEDIVMTSTQCNLLNITCPLSGRPVTELADPVRSMDCKHIYEKKAILQYIKSKNGRAQCPVAACPKMLQANRVVCDALLRIEIDEMNSLSKQAGRTQLIEDFTNLNDDDDEGEEGEDDDEEEEE